MKLSELEQFDERGIKGLSEASGHTPRQGMSKQRRRPVTAELLNAAFASDKPDRVKDERDPHSS